MKVKDCLRDLDVNERRVLNSSNKEKRGRIGTGVNLLRIRNLEGFLYLVTNLSRQRISLVDKRVSASQELCFMAFVKRKEC
jgi:hypothetical protein